MNNNISTKPITTINYLQIKCKKCQVDFTNIKQTLNAIPVDLTIKSFYLKNIKFSSSINIAKDKSYGYNKCKCFTCKANVGKYIVIGSPSKKHLLTSIIINENNVELILVKSEEDKLNTKYELDLINVNQFTMITPKLIHHFQAKFNHMKYQIDKILSVLNFLMDTMKEIMRKLIVIKNVLICFYRKIVVQKNAENIEMFNKLIAVENDYINTIEENSNDNKSSVKTIVNSKRKNKRNDAKSNGKKRNKRLNSNHKSKKANSNIIKEKKQDKAKH